MHGWGVKLLMDVFIEMIKQSGMKMRKMAFCELNEQNVFYFYNLLIRNILDIIPLRV
jgi:hypothetical protein